MIFVMFMLFIPIYFIKIITKTNKPTTKLKLSLQKGFAFFNSIN